MTLSLGRSSGLVAVLIFAPLMGLLGLALKLSGVPSVLRDEVWRTGPRHVRTRRFVTPANVLGRFLRENQLDYLPALLDVAGGRVRLLVEWTDRFGVRITLAPEPGFGQASKSESA